MNFRKVFGSMNLAVAASRRRKGWWECSARILSHRPHCGWAHCRLPSSPIDTSQAGRLRSTVAQRNASSCNSGNLAQTSDPDASLRNRPMIDVQFSDRCDVHPTEPVKPEPCRHETFSPRYYRFSLTADILGRDDTGCDTSVTMDISLTLARTSKLD